VTLSPLVLWPMKSSGIDPLTFRPDNQARCILNLFLPREHDTIDRLMARMHDRINLCIAAQGKS
jgi:hypothetical protein